MSVAVRATLIALAALAAVAAQSADAVPADPAPTDDAIWTAIPDDGAPSPRQGAATVWTGAEFLVWGGFTDAGDHYAPVGSGGRYDPAAGTWRALPTDGAPAARAWHSAVWTGKEMIVWGGSSRDDMHADGFAYDPARDAWRPIATEGAPLPRVEHVAVWTGTEMLLCGGVQDERSFTGGGRYDPATDSWRPLARAEFLTGHRAARGVWTGREWIVFGGINGGSALRQGGRYDPAQDAWTPISLEGAPGKRGHPGMAWTGAHVAVFGGSLGVWDGPPAPGGGLYDPVADSWSTLPTDGAPADRLGHAIAWTGSALVVWGGGACRSRDDVHGPVFGDGAAWRPGAAAWSPLPVLGAPEARTHVAGAWTGSALIVWGGISDAPRADGGVLALPSD